jgi:FlaA1/EpsC-like NDP-sugar epimerase
MNLVKIKQPEPEASDGQCCCNGGRASLWRSQTRCLGAIALSPVFIVVYFLSYWLRFEGQLAPRYFDAFLATVGWIILVKVAMFAWFRVCQGWSRLVNFYDLIVLAQAASVSLVAIFLIDRLLLSEPLIPRSVYLIDWGTTLVLIGGARSATRGFKEYPWMPFLPSEQVPALIVGTSDTAESLLRAIIRDGKQTYRVVGFLDDDPAHLGTRIGSVPVIGTLDQTCQLAARYGVREILIAKEDLPGAQVRIIVEQARGQGLEVKVLPSFQQMINGAVSIQPRQVSIDDLLRRDPVTLDLESIRRWIDGRVLLVTGSAGSIGSEICRQLLKFSPQRIVLVDRSETGQFFLEQELRKTARRVPLDVCIADILDERRMRDVLREYCPQVIFHAAAYKHVPLMESHPGEAVKNIILATRLLADLAAEHRVDSFVMISTDKAVNPTSVMGACKRVAEMYVQSLVEVSACRFVTVRFGNVLDSAGSVVQIFRQQIAAGGPVTVTDPNMRRFFMTIPEAARLVIQAGAIGRGGHILVLDMGEPVRVVDLAEDMIRLSGLRVGEDVSIEYVGLRPGEKLYEELHATGERRLATSHPKIIVADHKPSDLAEVRQAIDMLERLACEYPEEVVSQLCEMIPEYRVSSTIALTEKRIAA